MWKRIWLRWTVDNPATLGDWLWQILVVDFAAWLDRLTWRRVIAFIPVVILVLAYLHRIPIPPELMLVGDLLAYIDIFSMIFLIGLFTRVATVVTMIKQAADFARSMLGRVPIALRRLDMRHDRAKRTDRDKRFGRGKAADDDGAAVAGLVWG